MESKIFDVNKFAGIGCAGFIGHINSIVDKIKEKLSSELNFLWFFGALYIAIF